MSALPTIQWTLGVPAVIATVVAAVVYFSGNLVQSNLRKLFEYLQLDSILTRSVKYAREHKIFWFLSGILCGALITLVTLPYLTAANEPYVKPVHDSRVKWNITKWISGTQGNIEPFSMVKLEPCNIVIVRLQDAYAEDFATDWKEIFAVIKWPVSETPADLTIDKGITLRPQGDDKAVAACTNALKTTFSQYA
jgi:hypothetical protein